MFSSAAVVVLVFPPSVICAGGGAVAWGMDALKMVDSCLRAVVRFSLRCEMGIDGVGFCRASGRSDAARVTAYS